MSTCHRPNNRALACSVKGRSPKMPFFGRLRTQTACDTLQSKIQHFLGNINKKRPDVLSIEYIDVDKHAVVCSLLPDSDILQVVSLGTVTAPQVSPFPEHSECYAPPLAEYCAPLLAETSNNQLLPVSTK